MSTIIIRLQNLPLSAKAHDIRDFFGDLKIPKGSVNIVGGSSGDAFIGFQTDEDARLAMLLDGRLLHQAKIRLMLSSRREMEQVIADAQALAGAAKQQNAPSGAALHLGHQQTAEVKVAAEDNSAKLSEQSVKDGGQWKSHNEVSVPVVSSSHSALLATQQTTAPSYQQLFGGDSWKNPQLQQNVPSQQITASGQGSHSQLFQEQATPAVSQSTPIPVFPGSSQPSFGGVPPSSLGPLHGSPNKTHNQQQLPNIPQQPPGFPPPLNVPAQPLQPMGIPQQQQMRPSNLQYTSAGGDGFFNQQPPTGYHNQRFPAQPIQTYTQQQNFRPGQALAQHQNQFGIPNQANAGGQFRPSRPPFGRRGGGPGGAVQKQFGGATHGMGFGASYSESKSLIGGQYQQQHFQPRQSQYQQRFEGGGGINGPKRRRSRSPPGEVGQGKRFYNGPLLARGNEINSFAQFPPTSAAFPSEPPIKERVCVQLSNVPYKATFFDVKQFLSSSNAECVKVTRVYQPDRNYSDRWIVEFDNEKDARSVIRYHGEINNRTIRSERIPARKADEQYAVAEPDDKGRGDKRSSDEPNRRERDRGGRGERDRPRERERDRGSNRSRSPRGRRGRSNDQIRTSHSEKGGNSLSSATAATTVWAKEDRTKQSDEKKEEATDKLMEQQRQRSTQQPSTGDSTISMGPMNLVSNAAVFGAFSFPDAHNNANFRSRGGSTTAQIGIKANEPKPLRAFEFFPSPPTGAATYRAPIPLNHLESGGSSSRQTSSPPPANQQQAPSLIGNIPSLIRPASSNNGFWPRPSNNNALSLGTARQQLTGLSLANSVQQIQSANLVRPPTVANPSNGAINVSVCSLDTSIGSTVPGLVIQEDYSMDEAESDNDARLHSDTTKTDSLLKAAFASANQNAISDQPPLDLLEPDDASPALFHAKLANMDKRSFDSAPNKEFTSQELELRPHLSFLERYREDPNLNSCIRLENVPRMVYAEQLAEFLGVQFDAPYENISRMQNGVLYINLTSEAMATKAASRNMNILNGHQIVITQLKRAEMADAIRQNMIIIREMYRVSVVVRGFPLVTQLNEVVALFERFNLNKDGAEKCTVKPNDTVSTFLLTFSSAQDCRDAIRMMNDKQIAGGAHVKVFQPTDVASQNRTA